MQLSASLIGILSQRLIPSTSGGLVPVFELLLNTNAVGNLIREKRTNEIDTIIEMGTKDGMIDIDRYIAGLVREGIVSRDVAYTYVRRRGLFDRLL
jgi:twitching motility protein PilT